MESTTLPRPGALAQRSKSSSDQIASNIEDLVRNAKGRDMIDNGAFDLLTSTLNADDAAAMAPLAFNQKVAAVLLGESSEQVLDQTFQHVVEYVARTTDPGSRQSAIALITNPIVAKQIWGSGYKERLRELAGIIVDDLTHGQKHASRNGHGR